MKRKIITAILAITVVFSAASCGSAENKSSNTQEEKVSFKELIKSLGMTQKEFSETFGIPMGTLRHWISGDRECPVYTKRMLAYMVELKRLEAKRNEE